VGPAARLAGSNVEFEVCDRDQWRSSGEYADEPSVDTADVSNRNRQRCGVVDRQFVDSFDGDGKRGRWPGEPRPDRGTE
jgi:hypothetical protein